MSSTPLSSLAPAIALVAAGAAGAYLLGFLPGAKASSMSSRNSPQPDVAGVSADHELPRGAWTKPLVKAEDLKGPIRVTQLWIHPIKSCRGTSVQQARYNTIGLENDRKWAIMDAKSRKILTARDLPKMVLIHPVVQSNPSSTEGILRVEFPANSSLGFDVPLNPSPETLQEWELLDDVAIWHWSGVEGYICQPLPSSKFVRSPSEQLSTFLGRPVDLVMKGPRLRKSDPSYAFPSLAAPVDFQDGYPLLLASEESLDATNDSVRGMVGQKGVAEDWKERKLEMQRFRPNIVLAGAGIPFAEDGFKHIIVVPDNSASQDKSAIPPIAVVSKCTRCRLPNVDPSTAEVDTAVPFKVLMSFRTALAKEEGLFSKSCFGVNGAPSGEGVIHVGDVVEVTEWLDEDWK